MVPYLRLVTDDSPETRPERASFESDTTDAAASRVVRVVQGHPQLVEVRGCLDQASCDLQVEHEGVPSASCPRGCLECGARVLRLAQR